MDQVNEGQTFDLLMEFFDPDDVAAVPTAITWKVHDYRNGTELVAETTVGSPASSVLITVPEEATAIVDPGSEEEPRVLTTVAIFAGSKKLTGRYLFSVINFGYLP